MHLADEEALARMKGLPRPPVDDYPDDVSIWELLLNYSHRAQRKRFKRELLAPVEIHSKYAFNIKSRDFKIKKYINHKTHLRKRRSDHHVAAAEREGSAEHGSNNAA